MCSYHIGNAGVKFVYMQLFHVVHLGELIHAKKYKMDLTNSSNGILYLRTSRIR